MFRSSILSLFLASWSSHLLSNLLVLRPILNLTRATTVKLLDSSMSEQQFGDVGVALMYSRARYSSYRTPSKSCRKTNCCSASGFFCRGWSVGWQHQFSRYLACQQVVASRSSTSVHSGSRNNKRCHLAECVHASCRCRTAAAAAAAAPMFPRMLFNPYAELGKFPLHRPLSMCRSVKRKEEGVGSESVWRSVQSLG
jgi:hypothetical protein